MVIHSTSKQLLSIHHMQITKSCIYQVFTVWQEQYQVIYMYVIRQVLFVIREKCLFCLPPVFISYQSWPPQSTLRKTSGFSDWCVWKKELWLSPFCSARICLLAEGTHFPLKFDRLCLPLQREICGCPILPEICWVSSPNLYV